MQYHNINISIFMCLGFFLQESIWFYANILGWKIAKLRAMGKEATINLSIRQCSSSATSRGQ